MNYEKVKNWPIRGGSDAVFVVAEEDAVRILYGHDGINATIKLDYGEAREVASAILEAIEQFVSIKEGKHEGGVTGKFSPEFEGLPEWQRKIFKEQHERLTTTLALALDTVRLHFADDPDLYQQARDRAREQFVKAYGDLDWMGIVYLIEMLLDATADDLEIARHEVQGAPRFGGGI